MRLLDLLKRVEWVRIDQDVECPECGEWPSMGHAEGCGLKAAIDHFESVATIPEAERTLESIRYGASFNPLDHEGMK